MENKKVYISGNTALVPERKTNKPVKKDQYEKLRKSKQEREQRLRAERRKRKKSTIQLIALLFIMGVVLIGRYASIFSMQKELSTIKKEINSVNAQNEALKLDILKLSSFQNIKQSAEKHLKMVEPDKNNAIAVDLSKNNFKSTEEDKKVEAGIVTLIKKYLF